MRHKMTNSGQTTRNMVWAIVALVGITLAAVVAIVALEGNKDHSPLVLQIIGILAPTLAVLVTLQQVARVQERVETVAQDTHDLTNGLLERKVRTGVADVLHPNLVDPETVAQVEADRDHIERRENGEGF